MTGSRALGTSHRASAAHGSAQALPSLPAPLPLSLGRVLKASAHIPVARPAFTVPTPHTLEGAHPNRSHDLLPPFMVFLPRDAFLGDAWHIVGE